MSYVLIKTETIEFTQLHTEENRIVMLKDVKKFSPKIREYFFYVHS